MMKNLFCLHGFTHNGAFFDRLKAGIENENIKVFAPTFPGRGNAENWSIEDYNYQNYVNFLKDKTNNLENISLLGSSMGGLIAMMYIQQNPDKVDRLILNDIGNFISSDATNEVGRFVSPVNQFESNKELENRLKEEFLESNLSSEEFEYVKSIYSKGNRLKYDMNIAAAFWRKGKQKRTIDLDYSQMWEEILSQNSEMKILIIRGQKSKFLSLETAQKMCNRKNIFLEEVENVGHLPLFLNETQISLVDNFLSE